MKKQILSMALAACMIGTVCSGCGQTTQDASSLNLKSLESEKKDKNAAVELTVWGAEEDQELLKEMVDSFQQKYKGEASFKITISAESEATCKEAALADVGACADVFAFADDQLMALAAAGVLKPIENADTIKKNSLEGAVNAASINEKLYAYPLTADNGYFMFYNKKYFNESDVKSLESMLSIAASNGKYVTMDWEAGWYLYSFFANTGLSVTLAEDGINNECNWNTAEGEIKGVDIAQSMLNIAQNPGFKNGTDAVLEAGAKEGSVIAGISGVWQSEKLKAAWGDNFAAVKLPTYSCAGKDVQMGSFVGYKMIGVNSGSKQVEWATKLAEWITSQENQELRFKMRGQGPANIKASETEEVKNAPAIRALLEQSEFGTLQRIGGRYWEPMVKFGSNMATNNLGHKSLQKVMDELVAEITATE